MPFVDINTTIVIQLDYDRTVICKAITASMHSTRRQFGNLQLFIAVFLSAIDFGCFTPAFTSAATPTATELSASRDWVFSSLRSNGPYPFDFIYGGRHANDVLKNWQKVFSPEKAIAGGKRYQVTFSEPGARFEVTCDVIEYSDFPAVEWVLRLKNKGMADSPILQSILPLNTDFANSKSGAPFGLRYALGSHERSDDFRLIETRSFNPAETMTFTSFGGRSSDGYLPFFNLLKTNGGLMLGVGWTGQWTASFRNSENGHMSVRAGMEYTHLALHPGEEIRTPAILLVFWDGSDPIRGHNLLRGLLRDHYTPRPGGKPLEVPLSISAHGTYPFEETTEANMVAAIDRVAQLHTPFDTWWIDTGWFTLINKNWARSVGNVEPDPVRFPHGMRPVREAAHRNKMKFLLWFEPERVMADTWLAKNHPDWLIQPPSDVPYELSYMYHDGFHLLDLGNTAARKWLTDYVCHAIDEMQLDVYRQDFNMFPVYYWRHGEADDRQGMNEIRYVTGLYQFWDDLLAKHPNLLIDNCASGGRRIDFEMLRRSVPLFRSDIGFANTTANQAMEWALSHWIPFHGMGTVTTDPYAFRSGLGAVFTVATNLNESQANWDRMNELLSEYKTYRGNYAGDYYPLTPYSLADDVVIAWQFDRLDEGTGIIQAFRRPLCADNSLRVKLRGLDEKRTYRLTDVDKPNETVWKTGRELTAVGLKVELPAQPCAVLIRYVKDAPNDEPIGDSNTKVRAEAIKADGKSQAE